MRIRQELGGGRRGRECRSDGAMKHIWKRGRCGRGRESVGRGRGEGWWGLVAFLFFSSYAMMMGEGSMAHSPPVLFFSFFLSENQLARN